MYKLPKILIIALKRFKTKLLYRDKNTAFVDFPLRGLNMNAYLADRKEGENWIYDCFAVSNHFGGLGGGHYTAFAYNEQLNTWLSFDDSVVSRATGNSAVTSAAYVLFYRKVS